MLWGYEETNGPDFWYKIFPSASGDRQSPIDIKTSKVIKKQFDSKLTWKYPSENNISLINTGYCWKVDFNKNQSVITGGPLDQNLYQLEQFHCHWGNEDNVGSEHTIDGQYFSGELHLVHWNNTKYKSFSEAASFPDGLAVVAVLLSAKQHHKELDKITSMLHLISHKDDRITLPSYCDIEEYLPKDTFFWSYNGSLTTPPCSESVTWIIFKNTMHVSHQQLEAMRSLNSFNFKEDNHKMMGKIKNNFRPPQPLGMRIVQEFETL